MRQSTKSFIKYVSLNMLGMLGLSIYILADTLFIAQDLGEAGIAALNLSIPAFGVMQGIGLMLGLGGATRFRILLSQQNKEQAKRVYSQTLLFAILLSLVFVLLGLVASNQLAWLSGADAETFSNTAIYLRTILTFAPFFILNSVLQSFVRNNGDPSLSMAAMVVGSLLNILLDYVFMFLLGMGMFGAALATSIAPIISISILSIHYFKPYNQLKLTLQAFQSRVLKDVMYLGSTAFINEVAAAFVIFTFNIIIFSLEGNAGLAAYGIIANIGFVVLSLFTGIAQGTQPLLSESYGYNDLKQMKQVLKLSLLTSGLLSILVYTTTVLFTDEIISAFNTEQSEHVAQMAAIGLLIYFFGFFFAGMNTVLTTYFSATDQPRRALFFSLLRGGIIILPLVVVLSRLFGMTGVWLSFVLTELIVLVIIVWRMNPNKRIKSRKL
ncbi:MATE family efflux transporter [Alkalibacterium sp. MB6]|uniref:MATE family efflux transporter n=1 Tax=Alkalibacterium sp. MB6 TaxID=2081965 RepID=UPI0013798544|nr:MATE family efflux transporter [Alkalibacterium sp. MB6]